MCVSGTRVKGTWTYGTCPHFLSYSRFCLAAASLLLASASTFKADMLCSNALARVFRAYPRKIHATIPSKDSSVWTRVPSPSFSSFQTWIARIPIVFPDQAILSGGSTSSSRDTIFEPAFHTNEVPAWIGPSILIHDMLLFHFGQSSKPLNTRQTVSIGALTKASAERTAGAL